MMRLFVREKGAFAPPLASPFTPKGFNVDIWGQKKMKVSLSFLSHARAVMQTLDW